MTVSNRIQAIVPVKRFSSAKTRLACALDAGERSMLARTMLEDVLDRLGCCEDILSGTIVVTGDPEAAALARERYAVVLPDAVENGINAAVTRAIDTVRAAGSGEALMIVPSDIPQITRTALAEAAAATTTAPILAIAEAAKDGGTNLFACRPVGAVRPLFGEDSFNRHCRAALQAGISVRILCQPEISLDIDHHEDMWTFMTLRSNTRTHAFLSRLGVVERLERWQAGGDRSAIRTAVEF